MYLSNPGTYYAGKWASRLYVYGEDLILRVRVMFLGRADWHLYSYFGNRFASPAMLYLVVE